MLLGQDEHLLGGGLLLGNERQLLESVVAAVVQGVGLSLRELLELQGLLLLGENGLLLLLGGGGGSGGRGGRLGDLLLRLLLLLDRGGLLVLDLLALLALLSLLLGVEVARTGVQV